jgi:hypothetical protein
VTDGRLRTAVAALAFGIYLMVIQVAVIDAVCQ